MRSVFRQPKGRFSLRLAALALMFAGRALAVTVVMLPSNDSDGKFTALKMAGKTVFQSIDEGQGVFAGFMYFKRPAGASFKPGAALFVEADYLDLGGPGRLGMQYNAVHGDYQSCGFMFNVAVKNTGVVKTAVFKLEEADLRYAQNAGGDLRLTRDQNLRFHVLELRVSDVPNPIYQQQTVFLGPYAGPAYDNGVPVDSSTMEGKLIVGYQGWFRTPDDDGDCGWVHYTNQWGSFGPETLAVDTWPDMAEYTPAERHVAPGFFYPDGKPAVVFSSDSFRTVLRHFQWMEAYGIDGVAVQRFVGGLGNPDIETLRVLTYIRAAANLTGRTYFIEYDMTGCPEAELVPNITKDWHYLVDTLHITSDSRYLRQGGQPMAGVYGFFHDRFSIDTANRIVDLFQKDKPYQAFFAGAGFWPWRTGFPPAWKQLVWRMGSWQPWNTGNAGGTPKLVNTDFWAGDKAELAAHKVMYVPQIYPGGSADNRSHTKIGTYFDDRLKGDFLWKQIAAACSLKVFSVFLGMFDELDEGTQIFKVTNAPPAQRHMLGYQGLPSDYYLCLTGQGSKMLKGQIPFTAAKPECAKLTQPSIPEPLSPAAGAQEPVPKVVVGWSASVAAQAANSPVEGYELDVDGTVFKTQNLSQAVTLKTGAHFWRVRARNTLGNTSGWSLKTAFSVAGNKGSK